MCPVKCYNILFKFFTIILVLFFFFSGLVKVQAAIDQDQEILKNNRKEAQDLMNSNKNAQALYILERTAVIQDKIFTTHRDSVTKALEAAFIKNRSKRLSDITGKQKEIENLKAGNEDIDRENFKMIRNTLFFFGTLAGLAVLLLLNRFRRLSNLKTQLIASEGQLDATDKIIASGIHNRETANGLLHRWNETNKKISEAAPLLIKIGNDKTDPLQKTALQLQHAVQSGLDVLTAQHEQEVSDKYPVDLNQMIEEVVNQAYHFISHKYPDFKCTVVKDLEKILPKVELAPSDIRFVMFQLLTNAFEAIRDKRGNAPKGYDPKVTVSTRKLPRFVQIRVRDNGAGIDEKVASKVFDPFFSTKETTSHSGLGLSESKRIIVSNYKGELFIESDFTTGTDFIIRFPILTLM